MKSASHVRLCLIVKNNLVVCIEKVGLVSRGKVAGFFFLEVVGKYRSNRKTDTGKISRSVGTRIERCSNQWISVVCVWWFLKLSKLCWLSNTCTAASQKRRRTPLVATEAKEEEAELLLVTSSKPIFPSKMLKPKSQSKHYKSCTY